MGRSDAVIVVLFTSATLVAAVPPKLTVAPARKPVPVMVTAVPPVVTPGVGRDRSHRRRRVSRSSIGIAAGQGSGLGSVFVTTTSTAPAACAGAVAVIDALLTTRQSVADVPPILTVAPARKPVPAMVTAVPPLVVPELGVIELTVGAGFGGGGPVKVKPLFNVPVLASVLVTTTLVAPAAWAGVVAAIVVLFTTETPVAEVPPSFTVAPARKPVPLMVTAVPPLMVPGLGEIEVTVGAEFGRRVGVAAVQCAALRIRVRDHDVHGASRVGRSNRRDRCAAHQGYARGSGSAHTQCGPGEKPGARDRHCGSAIDVSRVGRNRSHGRRRVRRCIGISAGEGCRFARPFW